MIAAKLRLSHKDMIEKKITDAYSVHRVVYDLYEDIRTEQEKKQSLASKILYVDKGGDFQHRIILLLSDREPKTDLDGTLEFKKVKDSFLQYEQYRFEVVLNPTWREHATKKIVAIRRAEALRAWFLQKSVSQWGFAPAEASLEIEKISAQRFQKNKRPVTHNSATFKGRLKVTDRQEFIRSFEQGIGRARAFGFGLLQLQPIALSNHTNVQL